MKVTLMMAMTADGKIAKHHNHPANWTSKSDKKIFIETTKKAGAIIMGKTTYDTIGRPLPGRLNLVLTRSPEKYQNIPNELEYITGSPEEIVLHLEQRGYSHVILCGGTATNSDFAKSELIDELLITIEPKLFGGGMGLFKDIDLDINLELLKCERLGDNSAILHYKVIK